MKRKIVEQGLSKTKVISIPIKWARKYGLEKGDDITLEESGPKLILTTPKTLNTKETITFDYASLEPHAHRILAKMYIAGYDHVELNNITDKNSFEKTKKEIEQSILGFEIIEETPQKVVFESIISETEEQYNNYEQKVIQTALQYAKAIQNTLTQQNYHIDGITNIETANNKFSCYCERYLNKKGHKNYAFTYLILWSIEKITDEYKYLLHHTQKQHVKLPKEILDYYDKTTNYFERATILYTHYNMETLSQLIKQKANLTKQGETLIKKQPLITHHLLNIIKMTFDILGNIVARNACIKCRNV